MSSFEPLFTTGSRTRITPRGGSAIAASELWIPRQVGTDAPRAPSIFESEIYVSQSTIDAAKRVATDAADAQARQLELDAAYLRGVTEGRDEGERAERARLRGAVMAAESALDDVRTGESRWLANIEENIAAIAIAVAQQVITREVTTSGDIVVELVTRALQEFGLDQALSIRVNPGDLEALLSAERVAGDDVATLTKGREVRWMSDARIEKGGCVVEGRERIVDGRVDTGLERLYRRLTHTNA